MCLGGPLCQWLFHYLVLASGSQPLYETIAAATTRTCSASMLIFKECKLDLVSGQAGMLIDGTVRSLEQADSEATPEAYL